MFRRRNLVEIGACSRPLMWIGFDIQRRTKVLVQTRSCYWIHSFLFFTSGHTNCLLEQVLDGSLVFPGNVLFCDESCVDFILLIPVAHPIVGASQNVTPVNVYK